MTLINRTMLSIAAVAFAAATTTPPVMAQDAAQVKKGLQLYGTQKCSMCHSIAGAGNKTNPLDGVGKKLSADEIRLWIVNPKEATAKAKSTKKPPMPDKYGKLPAEDIDALAAYMQSLK